MSQLIFYGIRFAVCGLVWILLLQDWLPFLRDFHDVILYVPVYAIVMLGVYAVCSVLYGVAKFNDCPQARDELLKEISEAKEDLQKRKIL